MIQKTTTYRCRTCESENIVKNGTNRYGNQQYWCKDCGARRVLEPKRENPVKKNAQPKSLQRAQQHAGRGPSVKHQSSDLQPLVG